MEKSHSGFELAEIDLKLRGPGEIFGTAQSGFPELKVATWNNYELIKDAKEAAEKIIKNPVKFMHQKAVFFKTETFNIFINALMSLNLLKIPRHSSSHTQNLKKVEI